MRSNVSLRLLVPLAVSSTVLIGTGTATPVRAETSPDTSQLDILGPPGSVSFGSEVLVLGNGNYVVTDAGWSTPDAHDVGAVHLYDGRTNELISTLTGSQDNDGLGGSSLVAVGSSNFVVSNQRWDNGDVRDAGAATWVNGETGLTGEVSPANSLVGTGEDDGIGSVIALAGGNFVVVNSEWSGGQTAGRGAVTWASGDAGITGPVTSTSSLVGTNEFDAVGYRVLATSSGDLLVSSPWWDNAGVLDAGAVTLIRGESGATGPVTSANSLVGTQDGDRVGDNGAVELANGNLVAVSTRWANGSEFRAGAATWIDPAVGTSGPVSETNSIVGSGSEAYVGAAGVVALANGNYVVSTLDWASDDDERGAYTWGNGATGSAGVVSEANSFIGAPEDSPPINSEVVGLANGNYVVSIASTDLGGNSDVGSVTWGDGAVGLVGTPNATDSLVGSQPGDAIGSRGVIALSNGNYVVASPGWDVGTFFGDAGAVTWGDGDTGVAGAVSSSNSLIGNAFNRRVGSGGVTALANGNYVVASPDWNGFSATTRIGAVTWGDGEVGTVGRVGTDNSLVGSSQDDRIGSGGVVALSDGAFVVESPDWDSPPDSDVGAVTWFDGTAVATGTVAESNSLIGSLQDAHAGTGTTTALADGSYLVTTKIGQLPGGGQGPVRTWRSGGSSQPGTVDDDNSFGPVEFATVILADPADTARQIEPAAFLVSDRLFGGDRGAVSFAASGQGVLGQPSALTSAIGRPPGFIRFPSARLTSGDAIAVPTFQNRVLLLQLDREPQFGEPVDIAALAAAGASGSVVEFTVPVADDVRDGPIDSVCAPASGSEFPLGDSSVMCVATDSKGQSSSTTFTVTVTSMAPPPDPDPDPDPVADIVSLEPGRLLDTRASGETVDDLFEKDGKVAAGEFIELDVTGRGGVPADAASVVLNVTLINPSGPGFLTAYPCGDVPNASSMNAPKAGGVVANEVIAKVSAGGAVCLFSSVETHVAADVSGFVPAGSPVTALDPARLLDTRAVGETVDDLFEKDGRVAAGGTVELDVLGRGGVPAADVGSVVLNVTMIQPAGGGFVTMYPCGDLPNASSMNAPKAGGVVANEVIAKVSADGKVCLFSSVETHLAADVVGFVPDGSGVNALDPGRLLDTRASGETVDDLFEKDGRLVADGLIELDVLDRAGVPASGVGSVVLNVTMIQPAGGGFVTMYPCGDRPNASSMNAPKGGGIVANEVIAKVSAVGTVCLYTSVDTHLAADVTGYIAS